jgi:hypothetical protein
LLKELIQEATSENEGFYADSTYHSAEMTALLHEKVRLNHAPERAYRNKLLTIIQKYITAFVRSNLTSVGLVRLIFEK